MLRKLTFIAVALAALGAAALSPTAASAREWKGVGMIPGSGWTAGPGGGGGYYNRGYNRDNRGYGYNRGYGGPRYGYNSGYGGPRYGYGRPAYYGSYGSCTVRRAVATPYGVQYRFVNRC